MRSKVFEVPVDSIVEFAEVIGENELEGLIIGTGEDSTISVQVNYEREDSEAIFDLMDMIEGSDEDEEDDEED